MGASGSRSSSMLFNGTSGTAVVYHDSREYFRLMMLRGHILPEWFAVCPPGPAALSTLTLGCGKLKGQAGSIGVRFSTVQVVDGRNVDGAVEVTLRYGAAQRTDPGGLVEYKDGEDGVNRPGFSSKITSLLFLA
jgi:hypothetical protein